MAQRRPKGMVFVSYAHEDRKRVEPLMKALAARFNAWWDREIELGETWRRTLIEKLDSARCVVVVWTAASVGSDFIWSELDRVKDRCIVVPVKLDQNARIAPGFDQIPAGALCSHQPPACAACPRASIHANPYVRCLAAGAFPASDRGAGAVE